jgi:hypothetical protein
MLLTCGNSRSYGLADLLCRDHLPLLFSRPTETVRLLLQQKAQSCGSAIMLRSLSWYGCVGHQAKL